MTDEIKRVREILEYATIECNDGGYLIGQTIEEEPIMILGSTWRELMEVIETADALTHHLPSELVRVLLKYKVAVREELKKGYHTG